MPDPALGARVRRCVGPRAPGWLVPAALLALFMLRGGRAEGAPTQRLTVGDPLEHELRVLDLFLDSATAGRVRLPHLFTRPLEFAELEGDAAPPAGVTPVAARSLARLERVLGLNARPGFTPDPAHPGTPRLHAGGAPEQRLEISAGIEGAAEADRDTSRVISASGLHVRAGVTVGGWLVFSHLVAGHFDEARSFSDPVIANTDVTTLTEESYIAYSGPRSVWSALYGRSRSHWGPGDEGSLVLSRTAAPVTNLTYRGRLESLALDGIVLNGTLDQAAGEQLAAHRLEWQPVPRLRVGVTEAARYKASSWSPLYVVGVIPYVLVQRLLVQDEPDSADALRNNVMVAADAAWRAADGTRFYGELLVDDLHSKTSQNPDKIAWQLGWDGAGMIGVQRLTWGGEFTRVWRYVYTSYFGRTYEAQGRPLGFPTGPDSRRVRVHVEWDPAIEWQFALRAANTDQGEGTLSDVFVPGSPGVDASQFLGVVQHTREVEGAARWWPASGVDVALTAGWRSVSNLGHASGAGKDTPYGRVEIALTR